MMDSTSSTTIRFWALNALGFLAMIALVGYDHRGLGLLVFLLIVISSGVYVMYRDSVIELNAFHDTRQQLSKKAALKISLSKSSTLAPQSQSYRAAAGPSPVELEMQDRNTRLHTLNGVLHVRHRSMIESSNLEFGRERVEAVVERDRYVIVRSAGQDHVVLMHENANERAKAIMLLQAWAADELHEETEYEPRAREQAAR